MSIDFSAFGRSLETVLRGASNDLQPPASQQTTSPADSRDQTTGVTEVPFVELARGTEPLPLDYDLALLSLDVGNPESAGPGELNGWARITELPPGVTMPEGGWIDGNGVIHGPDGLQCAIYQRGDDYVLVFAGTGVTGPGDQPVTVYIVGANGELVPVTIPGRVVGIYNDVQTDAAQAAGFCPAQHHFAMALGGSMVDAYPGQVIFAGHSLGGGLASAAALATGAPAVTFNAAGLSKGTIDSATQQRNEREGEQREADDYIAESESGGVRAYHTENDILTTVQDYDSPVLPGDLPAAIGHSIEIADPAWSPMHELGGDPGTNLLNGVANLLLTGHMMDTVEGGMFVGTRPVISIKGMTVTVVEPPQNADGLSAADAGQTVVTFADTPQGHAAKREFLITGQLPADMVGVTRVSTTGLPPNSAAQSMTTTTYYGETGLPVSSRTVVYEGGVAILDISRTHDNSGNEIVEDRTYTYTLTPADATEAAQLNVLFGYDPRHGPFQAGETTVVTLSHATVADLEGDVKQVPGGGDVNMLSEGDGDAGAFDSTTDLALGLTGTSTSSFADLLLTLRANAGRDDEPIEADVETGP